MKNPQKINLKFAKQSKKLPIVLSREEIAKKINELAELIRKSCGGETKTLILDKNNPEIEIGSGACN